MRTRSVSPLWANRQCEALGQSPEAKRNQSHPLRHFYQVEGTSGHVGKVTRDACAAREGTSGQGDTGTRGDARLDFNYYIT